MSDLREALKNLVRSVEDMSYAVNSSMCDEAIAKAEAALAQPEAVELDRIPSSDDMDARFAWLEAKAIDMGYVLAPEPEHPDSPHRAPIAPDERMRRALEDARALIEFSSHGPNYSDPAAVWQGLLNQIDKALSRADEGKYDPAFVASIKAAQAAEPEAVFDNADAALAHLFGADEGKESNPVLGAESVSGAHVAGRTAGANPATGATPPDATAQREAIARIIDPMFRDALALSLNAKRTEQALAKADKILSLQTRAGG